MSESVTLSLQVDDAGTPRAFSVDDLKAAATGAASQASLAAFLAANHTDLGALATALAAILAKQSADPATGAKQDTLHADLAELLVLHADLAAILAKESADPSTGANQTAANTKLDQLHTDIAAVLAKITSDPATQTTLAAVLAKLSSDPSTATGQATQSTKLDTLHTDLGTLATQTTAVAILAKLSADPATQTTLAAVLAKLSSDPATQTTAAAILAKLGTTLSVGSSATTGTTSTVASSASNVTLLALNTARKGWSVFNDSTAVLYVKFGATATTSDYTVQVPAGGYYESPATVYTGKVDGIWAAANGNARLTELS